jgi:hypothetical protein
LKGGKVKFCVTSWPGKPTAQPVLRGIIVGQWWQATIDRVRLRGFCRV